MDLDGGEDGGMIGLMKEARGCRQSVMDLGIDFEKT